MIKTVVNIIFDFKDHISVCRWFIVWYSIKWNSNEDAIPLEYKFKFYVEIYLNLKDILPVYDIEILYFF